MLASGVDRARSALASGDVVQALAAAEQVIQGSDAKDQARAHAIIVEAHHLGCGQAWYTKELADNAEELLQAYPAELIEFAVVGTRIACDHADRPWAIRWARTIVRLRRDFGLDVRTANVLEPMAWLLCAQGQWRGAYRILHRAAELADNPVRLRRVRRRQSWIALQCGEEYSNPTGWQREDWPDLPAAILINEHLVIGRPRLDRAEELLVYAPRGIFTAHAQVRHDLLVPGAQVGYAQAIRVSATRRQQWMVEVIRSMRPGGRAF